MPPMPSIKELERLQTSKQLVGYFGYGSLVNRATLRTEVVAAIPARLKGWHRTWRARPVMDHDAAVAAAAAPALAAAGLTPSLLSAHPAPKDRPQAGIDGLLVIDLVDNLPHIDAREFRYHRRDISLGDLEFSSSVSMEGADIAPYSGISLHVYEARTEHPHETGHSPILRSYLDAVMQGFLREFGEEGVHRFVTETDAFHTPIHEDRHEALYPRAVSLSPAEIELFDAALGRRLRPAGN